MRRLLLIGAFASTAFAQTGQQPAQAARRFTRADIAARGDNLDIGWLRDTSAEAEDGLETPEDIAAAIEGHLAAALGEIAALVVELSEEDEDTEKVTAA